MEEADTISGKIKGVKMAEVVAVSLSEKKGKKKNQEKIYLEQNQGVRGDIHKGTKRQVSLLAVESIRKIKERGLDVKPGDFAENITTEGVDLTKLKVGDKIKIGPQAVILITQIGKDCHSRCSIYYEAGDCVMPREGVFGDVLKGGEVKKGDTILKIHSPYQTT